MNENDINWTRVQDSIQEVEGLSLSNIAEVGDMVERALKLWLPADLERLEVHGIEKTYLFGDEKGIIDLWGYDREDGIACVIDWKSRMGGVNDGWLWRTTHNLEQRVGYVRGLLSTKAGYDRAWNELPVRATVRMVFSESPPRAHSIRVEAEDLDAHQATQYWNAWERDLESKIGYAHPWPKRMPEGCRPFGPRYECEFMPECEGKEEMPVIDTTTEALIAQNTHRSYSSTAEFKRCPERLRRLRIKRQVARVEDDIEIHRDVGSAFHLAVAEIYSQLFKVEKGGEL